MVSILGVGKPRLPLSEIVVLLSFFFLNLKTAELIFWIKAFEMLRFQIIVGTSLVLNLRGHQSCLEYR